MITETEISDWNSYELPCPHCGKKNGDLFDIYGLKYDGDTAPTSCGSCGEDFLVKMSVDVEYCVVKREQKP
jgi:uncharacterized protein (DUF983 family)